ncbi:MAG: bifunctional phosphopantothenoylcysteine decarboxylase/phosphopantothenate--cysteine ligase CoaBC [Candidatus Lokiarchaeota archaeon]|nr:bifunctional phosphopantothenoylcysteine decarboxylase/phosphopantothenate--cysteine ligase CoaBC [Candidatus Lokiarchaeota archaeon]
MHPNHPSKDIIGSESRELEGKTICVCLTGSVAISNAPSVCRQLMRKGADVYCVMTQSAIDLIHPNLLHWATGNKVITKLTGKLEHIMLAGERPGKLGKADLILVSPATANTISKIACGIDDTTVTTVVTTAFGSQTPIVIVPAMHESMYNHPIVQENIVKLKQLGVVVIQPRLEESKAKIALTEEIVNEIISILSHESKFKGFSFLLTAGPCREYLDPIRYLSNPSTGRMGIELAREIYLHGGNVTLILGKTSLLPPAGVVTLSVETSDDYVQAVTTELKKKSYDVFVSTAAICDFKPLKKATEKIQSDKGTWTITLTPTPKLLKIAREIDKNLKIVAFKAESNISKKELIERAYSRLIDSEADLMVANDVGKAKRGFEFSTNEIYIIDKEKNILHVPLTSKKLCSIEIIKSIEKLLKNI